MSAQNWITFAVIVGLCLIPLGIVGVLDWRAKKWEARCREANRAILQDWDRENRQIALASFQTKAAKGFSARLRSQVCAACGHPMNGMGGMCAISWCRCVCVAGLCESRSPDGDGPLQYEQGSAQRLDDGRDTRAVEAPNLLSAAAARGETVRTGAGSEPADSLFHTVVGFRAKKDA